MSECENLSCDWFAYDHREAHPCGLRAERPGEPCRFCDREVLVGEPACPACWVPVEQASQSKETGEGDA